jgi:hypothetical protein
VGEQEQFYVLRDRRIAVITRSSLVRVIAVSIFDFQFRAIFGNFGIAGNLSHLR